MAYQAPTESGGYLHLPLTLGPSGWVGSSVDTKLSFTQLYGTFEARIWFPQGTGLWPAFWGYTGGPEIDGMEVCANPTGTNGGNDQTELHQTVHWSSGSQGVATKTTGLAGGWHTYRWTWTKTSVAFLLDGTSIWTYSGANVPQVALPAILDLAVGGTWCGNPTSTTPTSSEMLVDWVHVTR